MSHQTPEKEGSITDHCPVSKKAKTLEDGKDKPSEITPSACEYSFTDSANPNLGDDVPPELFKHNLHKTISPPSVADSSSSNTAPPASHSSDPDTEPSDTPPELVQRNLNTAMKAETTKSTPTSQMRQTVYIDSSSDSESEKDDKEGVDEKSNSTTISNPYTHQFVYGTSSRHELYGYQFATKYLVTCHFGKNGPFSLDRMYDKEFIIDLNNSFDVKESLSKQGRGDNPSLMCNRLKIHSIRKMKDHYTNGAKTYAYKGGSLYYWVFVRIFSKEEKRNGLNTEAEMYDWMDNIRRAYIGTRTQNDWQVRCDRSVLLGSSLAHKRTVDTILLDMDVAEYAMLIHGTKVNKPKYLAQFFSEENKGARDLLG